MAFKPVILPFIGEFPDPITTDVTPASPIVGVGSVLLYTNPFALIFAPPSEVIVPAKSLLVAVILLAAEVDNIGAVFAATGVPFMPLLAGLFPALFTARIKIG